MDAHMSSVFSQNKNLHRLSHFILDKHWLELAKERKLIIYNFISFVISITITYVATTTAITITILLLLLDLLLSRLLPCEIFVASF